MPPPHARRVDFQTASVCLARCPQPAKAQNQIRLGQYNNGTNSNLATAASLTISCDTHYDVQVVADGKHVEAWQGPARDGESGLKS